MNRWHFDQEIDLNHPTGIMGWPNMLMYEGDHEAHEWRVRVQDDGHPVDMSPYSITAYFDRYDGKTVAVNGTSDGNMVHVVLPQSVYAVPGQLLGVLRAGKDGSKMTLAVGRWTVWRGPGDDYIDPGEVVPDLPELLNRIAEMETATSASKAAATTATAAAQAADEARSGIQADLGDLRDGKLDKAPGAWPAWTADEQAQARESIGAGAASAVAAIRESTDEMRGEVMAYERAEAAKYYRIVFDEMWDKTNAKVVYNASIGEVAFYDDTGEEVAIASAAASSELNTSKTAKQSYDRDESSYWMSVNSETDTHMLTFTLERAAVIPHIRLMPQAYSNYGAPSAFSVYASQDGETWQHSISYTEQYDGWKAKAWRDYDIRPYTVTVPSLRTEFNTMRDNYASVKGTELVLEQAAQARIKRLAVMPNSPMQNDATPENIRAHGVHAGLEVTDTQGQVTAFAPDMRLICMPAPWSHLSDVTIDGVACAADWCDWGRRRMIRRFASYAFKGRESLKSFGSNVGCFSNYNFTLPVTPTLTGNGNKVIGLCTHYPYVPYADIVNQTTGYGISITANTNGSHTLVFFDERFSTVEEFSAYLTEQNDAGTPVTFYYMLKSAVEEEIGAEDFARFEKFLLPGGDSTAANPDGCMLEMDYWKDFPTRNYGDWLYDLLSLKEMRAAEGSGGSGGGISLLNTVTVEEFGAVGDGLTDDTQAFIDALATGKNVLCLGEAYVISDRLNIMAVGQKMMGSGHTSLKFISTDPEKVGIDMRNSYCMLSGVSLNGTGVGFGLRIGRYDPNKWDSHNKNRVDDVRIYDFENGFTTTSKLNQSIFSRIVIYRCERAIYIPNTNYDGDYTAGVVGVIFDSCLIDLCKCPYDIVASNVCFNALNIGFEDDSQCFTRYGSYVFINSKYEVSHDSQVEQIIYVDKASHVYIEHHFSLSSSSETTAGFRAKEGNGLVFIGCDAQTNGPPAAQTVTHFIAPDSTFNTPRAVWFGPGELTNAIRIPRPVLDDYPENRKYYVDFYDETSVPAFDPEADEGKVLKIVDGAAQWVTP